MKSAPLLLIVGYVWPEPHSSAAGSRMLLLMQLFQSQGWQLIFASPAAESPWMVNLEAMGVVKLSIQLNHPSFDQQIRDLHPQAVLFDRFMMEEQFGWRVKENCPDAMQILDTVDLHSLRQSRQAVWKEQRAFVAEDYYGDMAKREIASILRCDVSLIVSEFEMELLQQVYKIDKDLLWYYPLLFDELTDIHKESCLSFQERKDLVFIGNFMHEPNWQAVLYLKEQIWPLLRKKLPGVQLNIYGAYATQKVNNLHQSKDGFMIRGRATDAFEVIGSARLLLAPLMFGAGLKGKLLESMWMGTATVTTSIGAEGIQGPFNWPGAVADQAEKFVEAIVTLYSNEKKWADARLEGYAILQTRFMRDSYEKPFINHISEVLENLKNHRMRNFIGAILQYHTLHSARYLGKYIEAKGEKS